MTEQDATKKTPKEVAQNILNYLITNKVRELAEDYVENEYFLAGSRVYCWVESDYRSDDLDGDEPVCGECPPSDCESYSWTEIVSCKIQGSEVNEHDPESGGYNVTVTAWVAISSGDQDEEVDETVEPEIRTIYVNIEPDKDGDYCVVGTEE